MDDQACPRCKTTKYRNPSLKLMVNVCGHALCESCVDLLFLKGSGSCPECNVPLRRNNFRIQLFEDSMVEKEVDIRKRVLKDYNKKEEDFENLRSYNDYLEEIETIVYNLTNNIDVVSTNRRIEQYKRDNRDLILRNKSRVSRDELELDNLLETERTQEEQRRKQLTKLEEDEKKKKMRDKEALIDELMFSTDDAKDIVQTFVQSVQAAKEDRKQVSSAPRISQFSTGIQMGRQQQGFLPVPKLEQGEPFTYKKVRLHMDGPCAPSDCSHLESSGYLKHVRAESQQERAGGYRANIACLRALQQALVGLYHVSDRTQLYARTEP